jgi:drug/metabolite transporter (DMT)-like permease
MSAAIALLASLLWGTADFLGGTASRRLPVATVLAVSQGVALLGLLPLALVLGAFDEPRGYLLPGIAAGVCGLVALAAFYRALALGTMGVVAPIAALGVVVPIGAGLLDGESLSGLQVAGILAALGGVVLASGPELSGKAGAQPLVLAAVAAVGFGAVLVLLARAAPGAVQAPW